MKILFAVVSVTLGLVFAPAAQAIPNVVYTQGFDDAEATTRALSTSATGWTGSPGNVQQRYDYDGWDDIYWVQNSTGNSASKHAVTSAGHYTIADLAMYPATLTLDWAANTNQGMRIMVEVGGNWYGSAQLGTVAGTRGAVTTTGVSEWVTDSISTADTWYASLAGLPGGKYNWRDATQWSTTGQILPEGDITRFGIGWLQTNNANIGAVDNVLVTQIPEPGTIALLGLAGLAMLIRRRFVK